MERHNDFYNELKQTNSDLLAYLEECHKKSPYFDFSPTFQDYMDQMKALDKKFPIQTNSSIPAASLNSSPAAAAAAANNNTNSNPNTFNLGTTKLNSNNQFSLSSAFNSAPSALPATSSNEQTTTTTAPPTIFGASTTTPFSSTFTNPLTATPGPLFSASTSTPLFSAPKPPPTQVTATTTVTTSSSLPFGQTTGLFSFGNSATTTSTTTAPQYNFSFKMPEKESAVSSPPEETKGDQEEAEDQPPPEPKIDRFEEQDVKHSARCVGYLYVKDMDQPNKFQVIFRQEPDLRRVLLNEIVTPIIPVKMLPKAVQIVFPGTEANSKSRFYIAKLKDDNEAKALYDILNSNR